MSAASDIATEISTRISTIRVVNGFATEVGARVFRGKRRIAEADVPCVILLEGGDTVQDRTTKLHKLAQRYTIEAHDVCDPDNPNDRGHEILADLKKALFQGDPTLGRTVKSMEYVGRAIGAREDGVSVVFASIDIDVVYSENLAEP